MDDTPARPVLRVIGRGRAGGALGLAAAQAGWRVAQALGRDDDPAPAARGVDLLVIATPDGAVAEVAARVAVEPTTVVAHLAGSLGLEALSPHPRRAALHPLVSMPSPERGADALVGVWWAVAGDPRGRRLVDDLGGRMEGVADADRARYHAAACIAANHLVALLGQVERVAATVGVPLEAFWPLVRGVLDNVEALGPRAALTGPVARGDWATVGRHRAALDPAELPAYDAMAALADRLARGQDAGS